MPGKRWWVLWEKQETGLQFHHRKRKQMRNKCYALNFQNVSWSSCEKCKKYIIWATSDINHLFFLHQMSLFLSCFFPHPPRKCLNIGGERSLYVLAEMGKIRAVLGWTVSSPPPPPNSYGDVLTPSMTILGKRTFKEIIKVKWGHNGGP